MQPSRYLECLAADYARLRAVAPIDPSAGVPSCPGWSVADLTRHVGKVYLHKTDMRRGETDGAAWHVRLGPGEFVVNNASEPADTTISGPPLALLRWVWNRHTPHQPDHVSIQGSPEAIDELRRCIVIATQ